MKFDYYDTGIEAVNSLRPRNTIDLTWLVSNGTSRSLCWMFIASRPRNFDSDVSRFFLLGSMTLQTTSFRLIMFTPMFNENFEKEKEVISLTRKRDI